MLLIGLNIIEKIQSSIHNDHFDETLKNQKIKV